MNNLLVEGYSENTLRDYYYDLRSLYSHIKNPTNVTTKELKHYLLHLRQEHSYSNASIARRVAFLRTFYRFLVEEDIRKDNPSLPLRFPRVREKPIPFLSEQDIQRILSVIQNTRDKLIIKIPFLEGVRKDELLKLQKKHFDFNNRTVLIHGKGEKQRIIPLCNELCSELMKYTKEMSSEDYLFPLTGRHILEIVHKYSNQVGIHAYPHLLRHSFAANLFKRTKNIWLVSKMLGHSKVETTVKYLRSLNVLNDFSQEYQKAFSRILS